MATNLERMNGINTGGLGDTLENLGANIIRYGLVIILLWVGALKFTASKPKAFKV